MVNKQMKRLHHLCKTTSNYEYTDEILEEIIEILEEGTQVDYRHHGSSPLCEACRQGNKSIAMLLISYGADLNFSDKNKSSPLYLASSHGHIDVVQYLIDRGTDVNGKNSLGYAPLLSAVENGHIDVARLLIEHGADVNVARPNTFGVQMTLLTFVLFAKNDIPFADVLLQAGVIPHEFEKPLNFILLEFGDDCRQFIRKLIKAGFRFYCDGWVKITKSKMAARLSELTESEKDMLEFIEYENSNPPSLQRHCRTVIRQHLSISEVRIHLKRKVDQLFIPQILKRFLNLEVL